MRIAWKVFFGGIIMAMLALLIPSTSGASERLAATTVPPARHESHLLRLKSLQSFELPHPVSSTAVLAPVDTSVEKLWTLLIHSPSLVHSEVSAYAVNLTRGQVLASINPETQLTPGSITKLFTSSAALATLGPNFHYHTTVLIASSSPAPIYLVGDGDPWLEANGQPSLSALARTVARRISSASRVVGISEAFSGPQYGIGWPIGELSQNFAAATSALMAERSEVAVLVNSNTPLGQRPSVSLSFNGLVAIPQYFTVVNQATIGSASSPNTLSARRRLGTNQIIITGTLPLGSTQQKFVVSVGDAPLFAATLFQSALKSDGVRFTNAPATAKEVPPGSTVVATVSSRPLQQQLVIQNQYSINQMAENLYRELGQGSLSNAAKTMENFTQSAKISPSRVQVDGSGLSPLNQMSAKEVVQLLAYAHTTSWGPLLRHSLIHINQPTACGILCPPEWSYALPAGTQIWVKTGNLANQWNLAGYVQSSNGDLIAFAILDDGTPTAANASPHSPIDTMMTSLAQWPNLSPVPMITVPPTTTGTLPSGLSRVLHAIPGIESGDDVGISVTNAQTGLPIFQQSGETLIRAGLVPRLLLDEFALKTLKPTLPGSDLLTSGSMRRGVLQGNLIFNGRGDDISHQDLTGLASQLRHDGITTVRGDLDYVDPLHLSSTSRWPLSMPWDDMGKVFAPPTSLAWIANDSARLNLVSGKPASRPTINLVPSSTPVTLINRITVSPHGATKVYVDLQFHSNTFVIAGTMASDSTAHISISVPDPDRFCALELRQALLAQGIRVQGGTIPIASAPSSSLLAMTPPESVTTVVDQTLSSPSILPSEILLQATGITRAAPLTAGMVADVNDLTGLSLTNYLTADDVSSWLQSLYETSPNQALVNDLSTKLWISTSPEQEEVTGFIPGPNKSEDAVAILVSGTPFYHALAPRVVQP